MRVLFLCKRYYTNKDLLLDRFGRLFHIPVHLARFGADVAVFALDYRNRLPEQADINGVTFKTVPATFFQCLPQLIRLSHSVPGFAPDVIVASGDSHIGFLGARLAQRFGAKYIFDVYDYYPAFAGNKIPGMNLMFNSSVRRADVVFCASMPLLNKLAPFSKSCLLVENGVDRTIFRPMDQNIARENLQLPQNANLIGYFGSITPRRGPLLFDALDKIAKELPSAHLALAGRTQHVRVPDCRTTYFGEVAQPSVSTLIGACDVVTLPYASDPFNDMAGPCKIAEYIACERPVVATRVAGHESFFADAPNSLCAPEPTALARAVINQVRTPHLTRFPESLDWMRIGENVRGCLNGLVVK